jgi:tetratricopeptide (TPR) repeat protein
VTQHVAPGGIAIANTGTIAGNVVIHAASQASFRAVVARPVHATDASAPRVFVGRSTQVADLLAVLDPAGGQRPTAAVVSAVAGMAGAGKTVLAQHVAGIAVARGWFPGGAATVDLEGYSRAGRIEPGQAFAPLMRALGVPGEQIPHATGEQAAAYHRVLADRAAKGQAVLLVLDNASGADQVGVLLPEQRSHRVIVTSRHLLGTLPGARHTELPVLTKAEAVTLLQAVLRRRDRHDRTATDQPEAMAAVAELCGRLPLALQIAAALLADDTGLTPTALADELSASATRLATLAYGEHAVASAFDLSWRHLLAQDEPAARLLPLLTVNPGPDLSTQAAAALADQTVPTAQRYLRTLRRAHLLEPGTATGRWRIHDLVRLYAAEHAGRDADRQEATRRLLRHYLAVTREAKDVLSHLDALPPLTSTEFAGRGEAVSRLEAERANLVGAVTLATDRDESALAVDLANAMSPFFELRHYPADWLSVMTVAMRAVDSLKTARGSEDPEDRGEGGREGLTLVNYGIALSGMRRFDEAIGALESARHVFESRGDRQGVIMVLTNLAMPLRHTRRYADAIAVCQRAAGLCREDSDLAREGKVMGNLGTVLSETGQLTEAAEALRRSAELHRLVGNRRHEASTLGVLGVVLRDAGHLEESVKVLKRVRDMARKAQDRANEAGTVGNLGTVLHELGQFEAALEAHEEARGMFHEIGDRHSEAGALGNIGWSLTRLGRVPEAVDACRRAIQIYRDLGDRYNEARMQAALGLTLAEHGDPTAARAYLTESLAVFDEIGANDDSANIRGYLKQIPAGGPAT